MRNENFYQVSGWMINELGLKGVQLQIFAIIYGFSQDEECEFKGSTSYLMDWTQSSKPTVLNALKELLKKGLILKTPLCYNGVTFNTYKAVLGKPLGGSKEILLGVKKFNEVGKETLPNNNIDNNSYLKEKNKKGKGFDVREYLMSIDFCSEELVDAVSSWIANRTQMKKPSTPESVRLNINKAKTLANGDLRVAVEIFNNSTMNNWQGVFPLKNNSQRGGMARDVSSVARYSEPEKEYV